MNIRDHDLSQGASSTLHAGLLDVDMDDAELATYVRDGAPTGLLLEAVARLKGLPVAALAKAAGLPEQLVVSLLKDKGRGTAKIVAVKRVADVLGIDLTSMRLAAGRVHVFNLGNLPGFMKGAAAARILRGVGLLARGARVAGVRRQGDLLGALRKPSMFLAQTAHLRALFVSERRFDIGFIDSGAWVCGDRRASVLRVPPGELFDNLARHDLTEFEFDDLFRGMNAYTWDDVRIASRVNGVSKDDIMSFIESRAQEIASGSAPHERAEEGVATLRLVEPELRAAGAGW